MTRAKSIGGSGPKGHGKKVRGAKTKSDYPRSPADKVWKWNKQSFGFIYGMAPIVRVGLVREGVPPEALGSLAHDMGITKEQLYTTLGVPRATMERKLRERRRLNQDESERVVGIARLVGQVEAMVRESGDLDDFDAARWVAAWLDHPLRALGGTRPGSLMDTAEGREIVFNLVAQMQSGAYA